MRAVQRPGLGHLPSRAGGTAQPRSGEGTARERGGTIKTARPLVRDEVLSYSGGSLIQVALRLLR
jgi:hypothetical protein